MEVEVEQHSHTSSNQVDFHLSLICTDLTHLQVDAEVEVAWENEREEESEEAETEVTKCQTHVLVLF